MADISVPAYEFSDSADDTYTSGVATSFWQPGDVTDAWVQYSFTAPMNLKYYFMGSKL